MMPRCTILVSALAIVVLHLSPLSAKADATVAQIEAAQTVKEFTALGARKLSANEFGKLIVDRKLAGKGWSWIIQRDGTTSSKSDDGAWAETSQPWHMKGDAYCTPIKGKMTCRDVYLIGKYFRMTKPGEARSLAGWTAKIR